MSSVTAWTGRMTAHIVLSPKLRCVQLTSVRVSAECSCLTSASVTSWQSSARYPGALQDKNRWTRVAQSWIRSAATQEASAAGGVQARYDRIDRCPSRDWRQHSELTAGSASVRQSSSSRMQVINHNWSATKQHLHPQSVAEINRHSVFSGNRIRQCETSSGSRHKDTDQCL